MRCMLLQNHADLAPAYSSPSNLLLRHFNLCVTDIPSTQYPNILLVSPRPSMQQLVGRPRPAAGFNCRRCKTQGSRASLRPRRLCPRAQGTALEQRPQSSAAEAYNQRMIKQMQWEKNPYEYYPERGLYYHSITPLVIVGSQPQRADDIDQLKDEAGVGTILNLQEDKDLQYWGVDIHQLLDRAHQRDVKLVRTPARDFDPHSLRAMLPAAVAALERAKQSGGKVYVHCTAGLGRSPAVAIASLYWFGDMQLDEAYKYLTSIRPCGPKRDAIRGATYDLLDHRGWHEFERLPHHAWASLSPEQKQLIRERVLARGAAFA